jgi:hypothetical protein
MGVPRFWTGTLVGALTAPLFILAACGGGDDSVADPPVSPSATSSSTDTPQRETPEAFIRRWANEDTRMQNTGDTSGFRSMSNKCGGCESVADRVDEIYKAGGKVHTAGWSLLRSYESARTGKLHTIEVIVDSAPTVYTPSLGAPTKHLLGGREHFQVQLVPHSHSWLVRQFVQVSS